MADPWAAFRAPPAPPAPAGPPGPPGPADDPWAAFRGAPAAPSYNFDEVPPEMAGIPIIDKSRAYIAGDPSISTPLPAGGDQRDVALRALDVRGQNEGTMSQLGRAVMPISQGLTFNMSDEIASGGDALTRMIFQGRDPVDTFALDQEVQRQELQRQRNEHPWMSLGGEFTGGAMTGLGVAKKGATIVGNMANEGLSNLLPRMAGGAAEGATYGALAGFGGAEGDLGDRAKAASDNAWMGGAIGGAAVPAVDAASWIGRLVGNLARTKDPEAAANAALFQALERDRSNPEKLATAVEGARTAGQPDYRAIDAAGRNTQKKGKLAFSTPSEFRDVAAETIATRQNDQARRMVNYADEALMATGPDAFTTEKGIMQGRKAAGEKLFGQSYKQQPPAGAFYDDLLNKPIVQQAIANLERAAANSADGMKEPVRLEEMMVPAGAPGTVGDGKRSLSVKGWDYVRRYLDRYVNGLYENANSDDKALAPVYADLRNALKERLSQDVPYYGDALAKYADDSRALEAIDTGRQVITSSNPDEALAALRDIPADRRDLPNIGAARELRGKFETGDPGRDRTRDVLSPTMQKRLDALVQDPAVRALFGERVGRERDMVRTNRLLQGGSDTAENIGERLDVSGGGLASLFTGNPLNAAGKFAGYAIGGIARRMAGLSEPAANALGDILMSADPNKLRALSAEFGDFIAQRQAPSLAPSALAAGANAPRDRSKANGR